MTGLKLTKYSNCHAEHYLLVVTKKSDRCVLFYPKCTRRGNFIVRLGFHGVLIDLSLLFSSVFHTSYDGSNPEDTLSSTFQRTTAAAKGTKPRLCVTPTTPDNGLAYHLHCNIWTVTDEIVLLKIFPKSVRGTECSPRRRIHNHPIIWLRSWRNASRMIHHGAHQKQIEKLKVTLSARAGQLIWKGPSPSPCTGALPLAFEICYLGFPILVAQAPRLRGKTLTVAFVPPRPHPPLVINPMA